MFNFQVKVLNITDKSESLLPSLCSVVLNWISFALNLSVGQNKQFEDIRLNAEETVIDSVGVKTFNQSIHQRWIKMESSCLLPFHHPKVPCSAFCYAAKHVRWLFLELKHYDEHRQVHISQFMAVITSPQVCTLVLPQQNSVLCSSSPRLLDLFKIQNKRKQVKALMFLLF